MEKLYDRQNWHNNTTPALNESNLNSLSKAVDDIDDRVVDLAENILETMPELREAVAEAESLVERLTELTEKPPYIGDSGNWFVWDIETGEYVDSGIDASITVSIADITMLEPNENPYITNTGSNTDPIFHLFIPRGKGIQAIDKTATQGLVDTYTVTYSDGNTYNFSVTNGKTAYQSAVEGGYTGTEAEFEADLAEFKTLAENTENSAQLAANNAQAAASSALASENSAQSAADNVYDSEAWAVGQRNGVDVPSSDPAYNNNAKYWASQSAGQTLGGLSDVSIDNSTLASGNAVVWDDNLKKWVNKTVDVDISGKMNIDGGNAAETVDFTDSIILASRLFAENSLDVGIRYDGSAYGQYSVAEGYSNKASGECSHAEGYSNEASGECSHAEGRNTKAKKTGTHSEGCYTEATADYSHAEGFDTKASGDYSHAEGFYTTAIGYNSHAEGNFTTTTSDNAHAEGSNTTASGGESHAEGYNTTASGSHSHAEGNSTTASGSYSHAEGYSTTASGNASHAEGYKTRALAHESHCFGSENAIAESSRYSILGGEGVSIYNPNLFVYGNYNINKRKFDGSTIVEKYGHAFGINMEGRTYVEAEEIQAEFGLEGTIINDTTLTLDLETQAMYLLICSSYTLSTGAVYGATVRLVTAHGLSTGSPNNLQLGQTSNAPATIAMVANNKVTIRNAAAARATQFHLIRVI